MSGEKLLFDLSPTFNHAKLSYADHSVKACHDTNFVKGVLFSFAEREDFVFEGEWCFLFNLHLSELSFLITFFIADLKYSVPDGSKGHLPSTKGEGPVYHDALLIHEA